MEDRKHHYLIKGLIVFHSEEVSGNIPVNGVLIQNTQNIPASSLGKSQQVLQQNFFKNLPQDSIEKTKIIDVVLENFVYLGHMTQEEFQQPPKGMRLEEAQKSLLDSMEQANEKSN